MERKKEKRDSTEESDPFPDAKTLLVSIKRTRRFLERTARELLAGGTRYIILSGLGDALPLCVQLQAALESKNAATTVKIETSYSHFKANYAFTPGIKIYMEKHPDFKGSRISPGYVSFIEKGDENCTNGLSNVYDENPSEYFCSLNAGDSSLYVGGEGINRAFADILTSSGQTIEKYEALFKELLNKAIKENGEKTDDEVKATFLDNLEKSYPDIKLALCRIRTNLKKGNDFTTGAVFVVTFKKHFPHKKEKNMGMVYVVGPKGKNYNSSSSFLEAVQETAENVMTALCDYNGFVKREEVRQHFRMNVCRICLFSGGFYKYTGLSKFDIAKSILNGLAKGYRHGPSPRLNFAYDEDAFKEAWIKTTGLQVYTRNE